MSMFYELMMRKKEQIMYATIKGTLTENDGVFSGFSASNYLKTQQVFSPQDKSWEMVFRFTIDSVSGNQGIVSLAGNNAFSIFRNSADILVFVSSNGTSWNVVSSTIFSATANTTYTVKIKFTGNEYIIYSLENNEWVVKKTVSSSAQIYGGLPFVFGASRNIDSPFSGSIDLSNSYIKIGATKYKLQAVVGYTIVGSPTITDGVVSGFSNSNYLSLTQLPANTQKFEIVVCFESNSTDTPIIATNSLGFIIRQGNNQARVFLASTTSSGWDISNDRRLTALNNAKNWIKIEFTGTQYILSSSNDGINYTIEHTINNSSSIYGLLNSPIRIGQMYLNNQYYNGLIYINETYIKNNNKLWFNGLEA